MRRLGRENSSCSGSAQLSLGQFSARLANLRDVRVDILVAHGNPSPMSGVFRWCIVIRVQSFFLVSSPVESARTDLVQ